MPEPALGGQVCVRERAGCFYLRTLSCLFHSGACFVDVYFSYFASNILLTREHGAVLLVKNRPEPHRISSSPRVMMHLAS